MTDPDIELGLSQYEAQVIGFALETLSNMVDEDDMAYDISSMSTDVSKALVRSYDDPENAAADAELIGQTLRDNLVQDDLEIDPATRYIR